MIPPKSEEQKRKDAEYTKTREEYEAKENHWLLNRVWDEEARYEKEHRWIPWWKREKKQRSNVPTTLGDSFRGWMPSTVPKWSMIWVLIMLAIIFGGLLWYIYCFMNEVGGGIFGG